jgi:hypothetical protein
MYFADIQLKVKVRENPYSGTTLCGQAAACLIFNRSSRLSKKYKQYGVLYRILSCDPGGGAVLRPSATPKPALTHSAKLAT